MWIAKSRDHKAKNSLCFMIFAAMKCACCGGDMLLEKDIGNSILYKCGECGLSDSRVKKKTKAEEKVSSS
jgi:uncharacterized Zn finger protein